MGKYVDISKIISVLDKLYYEKHGNIGNEVMICKECGEKKDINEFDKSEINMPLYQYSKDTCLECAYKKKAKEKIKASINTCFKDDKYLFDIKEENKKLERFKNMLKIYDNRDLSCKHGIKYISSDKDEENIYSCYEFDKEYMKNWYPCYEKNDKRKKCERYNICNKNAIKIENEISYIHFNIDKEKKRFNDLLESIITDEAIKIKVILMKLNYKLKQKNYDAS